MDFNVHVMREAADMTLLGIVDWHKRMCYVGVNVGGCLPWDLFLAFLLYPPVGGY